MSEVSTDDENSTARSFDTADRDAAMLETANR
jgi:hypothetical protein